MNTTPPLDLTQVQVGGPTVSAATAQGFPVIAGYEILSELGRGGMGVVYEAKHRKLDRIIALKLMRGDDPLNKARFLAEGQVIAAVKHPHVVEVYDFGECNISPYIAMEYLTGGTFGDLLKTGLTPRVAAEHIAKIAAGVGAAHDLGIVHRDLKPGNVLLDHLGSPKVTDFGLAKRSTSDLTMTQDAAGTPAYMAPEQARAMKFVGPPADVWSLGVMLYESLTGKRPFTAETDVQLLATIQNDNPPTLRTISKAIPQDLETICLKCLEKEPERRYTSANELASDLQLWHEGKPIAAKRAKAVERAMLWVRRKPTVAAAWTLALLVLMLGGFAATATVLWRKAVEAEGIATQAKDNIADERERVAYARNIGLAHAEFQANGGGERCRMFLDHCPERLRGWDWRYIKRFTTLYPQARSDAELLWKDAHQVGVRSVAFSPDGTQIITGCDHGMVNVWDAKTGEEVFAQRRHREKVIAVTFNPDGSQIRSVSADGTFKTWNAKSGTRLLTLKGHTDAILTVTFSPDGTRIATGSRDKTAKVWDGKTGANVLTLRGHRDEVRGVAFSPDGTRLATLSEDSGFDDPVRVWDVKSGAQVHSLPPQEDRITSVAFSADGSHLITGTKVGHVKVWDGKNGSIVSATSSRYPIIAFSQDWSRVISQTDDSKTEASIWHTKTATAPLLLEKKSRYIVKSAVFNRDGSKVATGRYRTATIWDAKTGDALQILKGHSDSVTAMAFSPDGTQIVTGAEDETAKVWDTKTGVELLTLRGGRRKVTAVAFSPDGKKVVTGDDYGTAIVWGSRIPEVDSRVLEAPRQELNFVVWNLDGTRVATVTKDGGANVWDAKTGVKLLSIPQDQGEILSLAISPDGSQVVTCNGTLSVIDTKSGTARHQIRRSCCSVAFSSDGLQVVTGGTDDVVRVWDSKTWTETLTLKGHSRSITSVSFSPDGLRIASGSQDTTAKVWNAKTGQELASLKDHTSDVLSVAFSPDGSQVVTGSDDGTVKVWGALEDRRLVANLGPGRTIQVHKTEVHAVAFSPDGVRVISGGADGTARLRNTGRNVGGSVFWELDPLVLKGHVGDVYAVAFDQNGSRVVTGGADATARIWDAKSGEELITLNGHELAITSVAFTLDGSKVVTVSKDRTLKIWDAKMGVTLQTFPDQLPSWNIELPLGISPDGSRFVSGDESGAYVWDVNEQPPVRRQVGKGRVRSPVAFSLTGSQILTGSRDNTVLVWHAQSGTEIATLKGHMRDVLSAAFSPDGSRIVTGSADGTTKIWDAKSGAEILTLTKLKESVSSVSFSSDGLRIVAGSHDGSVKIYDATPLKD